MALKNVFIANLKKFRKQKKISQMRLAEKCNTAASYIGEIEIGRKFPSITMIEKIAGVLNIEAYRLFMYDSHANSNNEQAAAFFAALPPEERRYLISGIMNGIYEGFLKSLNIEDVFASLDQDSEAE